MEPGSAHSHHNDMIVINRTALDGPFSLARSLAAFANRAVRVQVRYILPCAPLANGVLLGCSVSECSSKAPGMRSLHGYVLYSCVEGCVSFMPPCPRDTRARVLLRGEEMGVVLYTQSGSLHCLAAPNFRVRYGTVLGSHLEHSPFYFVRMDPDE